MKNYVRLFICFSRRKLLMLFFINKIRLIKICNSVIFINSLTTNKKIRY